MKDKLFVNNKLEKRKTPITNGYGIFANAKIKKGEMLEECHFIPFNSQTAKGLENYCFRFPKDGDEPYICDAMPLGYGCIYNHANDEDQNADWDTDAENSLFIFEAIKDIQKGEEIFVNYGARWWEYRNAGEFYKIAFEEINNLYQSINNIQYNLEMFRNNMLNPQRVDDGE
jgi:SET domain-containing protein